MALVGVFSSGLLIKMMLGSVALAAVGSWAAASVMIPGSLATPPVDGTQVAVIDETPAADRPAPQEERAMTIEEIVSEANDQAARAHELAAQAKAWANCVSEAAIAHRGEAFDPRSNCPNEPQPPFGLGQSQRPEDAGKPDHAATPEPGSNGSKDNAPGAVNRPPATNKDHPSDEGG